MEKEMNFWDLCVTIARGIGRGINACWNVLARMIRLTYRYWYIVFTILVLALACALYLSRSENLTYRVNAIAMLNGASIQQFDQAYAPLLSKQLLPQEAPIEPYLLKDKAFNFKTFRVIDVMKDGKADYVDFKHKVKATDTVHVQMNDRLCLQFSIKKRDMELVPEIEQALLATLNSDEALQQSYGIYLENLREQVAFDHRQALKLDSLTSAYYFKYTIIPANSSDHGVYFSGDRRVRLFLNDIYKQQEHMQMMDYRLQLATAPVVLENHFAVDAKPKTDRLTYLILFFLMGWIGACLLAEVIDKRKALSAWLKA